MADSKPSLPDLTAAFIEANYAELKGIMLMGLQTPAKNGLVLDLNALPTQPVDLKTAVIKWLIGVNMARIKSGSAPIVTLQLVLKCPVWKVVKPPLTTVKLTKEGLFNKPSVKTVNQQPKLGSINKNRS